MKIRPGLGWNVPILERFNLSCRKGRGCWQWIGAKSSSGYGHIRWHGKLFQAHRISKMLFDGFDIGSDGLVLHHCDNPLCVRPSHLFVGTASDNIRDAFKKKRIRRYGEYNSQSKLTDHEVRLARVLYSQGEKCSALSRRFHISYPVMNKVVLGKRWLHVA
jgi:HNH endonuclease